MARVSLPVRGRAANAGGASLQSPAVTFDTSIALSGLPHVFLCRPGNSRPGLARAAGLVRPRRCGVARSCPRRGTQPTHGRVNASGRISALLTASVGLDPEATGRENIVLRGMYTDVHPREMRPRVEEIAEFTGLGYHIDLPVRTYSSGMVIRLCFAIATSIRPEILLMDEWLSAGDAAFLSKARERMYTFVGGSRILVLASHSIPILQEWCNRAILLDKGHLVAGGTVSEIAAIYEGRSASPALAVVEHHG